MKHIHDKGYKKLFSNPTIFRQLLETFVQEEWVRRVDFSHCERLDKSFVSDHYKETEEMRTMLTAAIEQDRQRYYEEGRQENQREVAKAMLRPGMVASLIAEITGLAEDDILALRVQMDESFTQN